MPDKTKDPTTYSQIMDMTDLAGSLPGAIQCKEGVSDHVIQMVQSIEDIQKDTQKGRQKQKFALQHLLDLAVQYEAQMCTKVSQNTQLLQTIVDSSQTPIDLGLNLDKLDLTSMSDSVINDHKNQGATNKLIIFGMKLANFLAISIVIYMFAKLILS